MGQKYKTFLLACFSSYQRGKSHHDCKAYNNGNITCSSMLLRVLVFSNFCTQARGFIKDTTELKDTIHVIRQVQNILKIKKATIIL